METNLEKVFTKYYGKKVETTELNVEGIDKKLPFDIYDGFAICIDGDDEYIMQYPQLKIIKESTDLTNAVIDFCEGITKNDIRVIHSLMAFNTLFKNGKRVQ